MPSAELTSLKQNIHGNLSIYVHQKCFKAPFYRKLFIFMDQEYCLFRKTTCKSDTIYRIRVVSALGRFGLGRFGQFLGWVVSALVGGSFRPIFEVSRFGPWSFRPKSIETIKV